MFNIKQMFKNVMTGDGIKPEQDGDRKCINKVTHILPGLVSSLMADITKQLV